MSEKVCTSSHQSALTHTGEQGPTNQDAVHRLQLSIPHNHPPAAHPQTSPAGKKHLLFSFFAPPLGPRGL